MHLGRRGRTIEWSISRASEGVCSLFSKQQTCRKKEVSESRTRTEACQINGFDRHLLTMELPSPTTTSKWPHFTLSSIRLK